MDHFTISILIERFHAELSRRFRFQAADDAGVHPAWLLGDLVEHAPDGIFVLDLDGRAQEVNDTGCRMLGYSRDEILEKRFVELAAPDDLALDDIARSIDGKVAEYLSDRELFVFDGYAGADPEHRLAVRVVSRFEGSGRKDAGSPVSPELEPTPDLAADMPEISEDGKTVTVKIRPGVKFSPPVETAGLTLDDRDNLADAVRNRIAALLAQAAEPTKLAVPDVEYSALLPLSRVSG